MKIENAYFNMLDVLVEHEGWYYQVTFRNTGAVSSIYKLYSKEQERTEDFYEPILLNTKSTKKMFGVMPREIFIKGQIKLKEEL